MTMDSTPPHPDVYRALAVLLQAWKFEELAVRAAMELEKAPNDRTLLGFLVSALRKCDPPAGAVEILDKILAADPDNDLALLGLGMALDNVDEDRARRLFQRLFDRRNEDVFQGPKGAVKMSSVVDFAQWSTAYESRVVEPPRDVTVFDPAAGADGHYQSDAVVSLTVPLATITPEFDFVINAAGEVLNGSGFMDISMVFRYFRHVVDAESKKAIHPWPARCIEVDEDAFFLSAPPLLNMFGHWVLDFLPRLCAWRRPGTPPLKLATSVMLDQHQRDTLSLFGVRESDVIWCEPATRYRFRSLTVVRPGHMCRPNPDVTRFLYSKLGPDPATKPKRYAIGRRVFVERDGTDRGRYVANLDDVRPLLEELGFESVRRPKVLVPRQNEIFQDAGIVLCVFGTDVITLYQMRPGADLVVLYPSYLKEPNIDSYTFALASLCATVGVRLHCILCESTAKRGLKSLYRQDIVVDRDALRDCLYGIIERRSMEYSASWETST